MILDSATMVLVISAFLTAVMSGVIGMGGGIILLTVMASIVPTTALIPLHGSVQLVSNSTRVLLHLKRVKWSIGVPILIGVLIGASLATPVAPYVQSQPVFKLYLALFILFLTWKPKFKKSIAVKGKFYFVGTCSGALTVLFGATGPFLAPFFLNEKLDRFQIISTKAFAQSIGHFAKIIGFVILGFSFSSYWQLIAMMVIAVVLGTYVGKKILNFVNEKAFVILFRGVITVLCLRMIFQYFNPS